MAAILNFLNSRLQVLPSTSHHKTRLVALVVASLPKTVDIILLLYDFIADKADDIKCHKCVIDGVSSVRVILREA